MADPGTLTQEIACPVDGCDWTHVHTTPLVHPDVLADQFGRGVMRDVALRQALAGTERVVGAHMAGHTAEQFLRTITRLRNQVTALELAATQSGRCTATSAPATPYVLCGYDAGHPGPHLFHGAVRHG